MGNLTSKNEEAWLKELHQQYKIEGVINDPRYGEGKLLGGAGSLKVVHKEISVGSQQQFEQWRSKVGERSKLKHPNILELIAQMLSSEDQLCSTFYKIHLIFEWVPVTLKEEIVKQKNSGTYFRKEEIENILKGSVEGLAKMQELRIPHQNLRANTISVGTNVKIADTPLLTQITAYQAVLQDFAASLEGYYLSPILTKDISDNNYQPKHNLYKSDVFTLGMILLSAALMQSLDSCYRYDEGIFRIDELKVYLEQAHQVYNSSLISQIEWMLEIQEDNRPDFLELRERIKVGVKSTRQEPNPYDQQMYQDHNDHDHFPLEQYQEQIQDSYEVLNHHPQEVAEAMTNNYYNQSDTAHLLVQDNEDIEPVQIQELMPTSINPFDVLINNDEMGGGRNSHHPTKNNQTLQLSMQSPHGSQIQPVSFAQMLHQESSIKQTQHYDFIPSKYTTIQTQTDNGLFQTQFPSTIRQSVQPQTIQQQSLKQSVPQPLQYQPYQDYIQQPLYSTQIQQNEPKFIQQPLKQSTQIHKDVFPYVVPHVETQIKYTYQEPVLQSQNYAPIKVDPHLYYQSSYVKQEVSKSNTPLPQEINKFDYSPYQPDVKNLDQYKFQYSEFRSPPQTQNYQYVPEVNKFSYTPYQPEPIKYEPQYNFLEQTKQTSVPYKYVEPAPIRQSDFLINKLNHDPFHFDGVQTQNQLYERQFVTETLPNGEKYAGYKIGNKREGKGKVYYAQGGYYDGNWKNDKIDGKGVLYYQSGRPAYDGEWVQEQFQGQGTLYNDCPQYQDIDPVNLHLIQDGWIKFVGSFRDDNKHGKGTLYFLNGDKFEGEFMNDAANGKGIFYKNGQVINGTWIDNIMQ